MIRKGFAMAFRLFAILLCVAMFPAMVDAQNASGPAVGTVIEDFELRDQHGENRKLSQLLSEGPVALVVNRSVGWCTQSKEQLGQLQRDQEIVRSSGLQVVGLTYDRVEVLKNFSDLNKISDPLLADPESKVIEQLGVINTKRKKGTLRYRVAHPLTILINQDRTVAGVVKSEPGERHSVKQLIDAWAKIQPPPPEGSDVEDKMAFIKVDGNKFIDPNGEQIIFKGMAISDPVKVAGDGHWDQKHFAAIKSWGANLVRIPVHPKSYRKLGVENYLKLLDQAVSWCDELEMYVIIDWHSIGNLRTRKFESADYRTSMEETQKFWGIISKHFEGNPTVVFYEIFNEPSTANGDYGDLTWPQWKAMAEDIIDVIYANDKNVIPLVGGFDWAYDLRKVGGDPIERPGVAYATHPYSGKCKPPREPHWEEYFGYLASHHPVVVSETGYSLDAKHKYMVDKDGSYRNGIIKYLAKKEVSWCAWVFDPHWSPALIKNYRYEPTHPGAFFRNAMLKK